MKIELPIAIEDPLRDLAARQGRDLGTVIADALQQYLDAISITDVDAADTAETQTALIHELAEIADWNAHGA